MARAYYNENDPQKVAWLRELITAGAIALGDVDERSIKDVRPEDVKDYIQCHWFAGIGIWSYALRCGGWDDSRPVWTGSCPCQPFSAAGQRKGNADDRHLWPDWYKLIAVCKPRVVFGEQVSSKDGLGWFDLVRGDLEKSGYAAGGIDICAAGIGAPHIRQRLYWVGEGMAEPSGERREWRGAGEAGDESRAEQRFDGFCAAGGMEHNSRDGRVERGTEPSGWGIVGGCSDGGMGDVTSNHQRGASQPAVHGEGEPVGGSGGVEWVGNARNARNAGLEERHREPGYDGAQRAAIERTSGDADRPDRPGTSNQFWRDADWLRCTDGKWRPVESGTQPLVNGAPGRVGRLRGYGDGIVAEQAAEFVRTYREIKGFQGP